MKSVMSIKVEQLFHGIMEVCFLQAQRNDITAPKLEFFEDALETRRNARAKRLREFKKRNWSTKY